MGKEDGGGQQPSAEGGRSGGARCSGCRGAVRPQCVAALLLGAAVALSALFWLPPYAGRAGPPDPGGAFAAGIVASFMLQKTVPELNETTSKLEFDIYEEIGIPNSANLYIKLTNLYGSTIAPPTTVQASIVFRVGNHQPSFPRMKQLAQTIANSSSRNMGLNHRVFGRVKQISLSSYLSHSLHSGGDTVAPSPAPMPHEDAHHHSRRHHHHRSHDEKKHFAPSPVPVHSPVQQPKYRSPSPSCCPYGYTNKPKNKAPVAPAAEPVASNHHHASPGTSVPHGVPPTSISPSHSVRHSPKNPKRHHSFAVPPALARHADVHHPARTPAMPPAPYSSDATRWHSSQWVLALLLCTIMGLP